MASVALNSTPTTVASNPESTIATTSTALPDSVTKDGVSYGISGFILFVFVLGMTIFLRGKCTRRLDRSERDAELDHESDVNEAELPVSRVELQRMCSVDGSRKWMEEEGGAVRNLVEGLVIDCQQLTFREIVGQGQFGAVYEAKLETEEPVSTSEDGRTSFIKVAVKTIKGAAMAGSDVEAFLREGILMKDFHHLHVLELVGVAFGDHGVPMIILPFMSNGSLRDYITLPHMELSVWELLNFGHMVCQGMDYLASQKFVHRDLATRNCMLDEDLCVKVADFGLSRDIYTREYYSSNDREAKLPVKWMALESLLNGVYTTKSDVWSFGVLLWELMTRGVTPYPDVTNWDMRNYVSAGRRMAKPDRCPDEIYDLMTRCWHEDTKSRPSFEDLVQDIDKILYDDDGDSRLSGKDVYVNVELIKP